MSVTPDDPDEFVRENRDTLTRVLMNGDDKTARALVLAALTRFGDDPDIEDVEHELEQAKREIGGER